MSARDWGGRGRGAEGWWVIPWRTGLQFQKRVAHGVLAALELGTGLGSRTLRPGRDFPSGRARGGEI